MVARSSLKAPDALTKGDKSSRQFMERLNDGQVPPGVVVVWDYGGAEVDPPLGWLKMDYFSTSQPGTAYRIKEYRELAYSGSPYIVLDEPNGLFYAARITATVTVANLGSKSARFIIKT